MVEEDISENFNWELYIKQELLYLLATALFPKNFEKKRVTYVVLVCCAAKLCKAFVKGSSANIKLSKPQLHKIRQSGGVLTRILGPLLKIGCPLIALKPLSESVLKPLILTGPASAIDAEFIKKKMLFSNFTKLIILNEEIDHIMKIWK